MVLHKRLQETHLVILSYLVVWGSSGPVTSQGDNKAISGGDGDGHVGVRG